MRKSLKSFLGSKLMFRSIALAAAAVLLSSSLSGCYFFPKEEEVLAPPLIEPPKIIYDTIDVKKGTIERKIMGSGSFMSVSQENLNFKFRSGYLKALNVKLGDKIKKGKVVAELDTDKLSNEIKAANITLRKVQIDYKALLEKTDPPATQSEKDKMKLDVDLAKLRVQDLQLELNKAKLTSPISGQVVYIDEVSPGDNVSAFRTIVTVADPTKLQLVYKSENTSDFNVGMTVDVKFDDKDYKGKIVMTPGTAPLDINPDLKKAVFIKVDKLPSGVEIGETANITFTLEKKEDVIVLPRNVVKNFMGRFYVQVLDNDIKYERDVQIGIQTPTEVEIVKGLTEGEKVIVQ